MFLFSRLLLCLCVLVLSAPAYAGGGGAAKAEGPAYIKLEPLVLPVASAEGLTQSITMKVSLEVIEAENIEKVEHAKPKIQDALLTKLYGNIKEEDTVGGLLNLPEIKKMIEEVIIDVVGEHVVDHVLIDDIYHMPL